MPLMYGKDKYGDWVKWGESGKKYYYFTEIAKKRAEEKAKKQAAAIYSSGWKGE